MSSPPALNMNGSQVNTVHSPLPRESTMPCWSVRPSPLVSRVSDRATCFNCVQFCGTFLIPAAANKLGR